MIFGCCLRTTCGFWKNLNDLYLVLSTLCEVKNTKYKERNTKHQAQKQMFISYEWLKELTGTRFSPQELRERLTMVGLAIDAVEQHDRDAVLDVEVPSNRPDC